jgi:hypothetical protein
VNERYGQQMAYIRILRDRNREGMTHNKKTEEGD